MKKFLKFIFILFIIVITLISISCKATTNEKLQTATTIVETSKEISLESAIGTQNTPPEVKNLKILPENSNTSQDLTLSYEFIDIDKDSDKSTIKWYKNDEYINEFDDILVIPKINLNTDDIWYAEVTPYDGKDFGRIVISNKITVLKKYQIQK